MRVRRGRTRASFPAWWLLEQLAKQHISQRAFAEQLGVPLGAVTGRSPLPEEKIPQCLELLKNWHGPIKNHTGGGRQVAEEHPWNRANIKADKATPPAADNTGPAAHAT